MGNYTFFRTCGDADQTHNLVVGDICQLPLSYTRFCNCGKLLKQIWKFLKANFLKLKRSIKNVLKHRNARMSQFFERAVGFWEFFWL